MTAQPSIKRSRRNKTFRLPTLQVQKMCGSCKSTVPQFCHFIHLLQAKISPSEQSTSHRSATLLVEILFLECYHLHRGTNTLSLSLPIAISRLQESSQRLRASQGPVIRGHNVASDCLDACLHRLPFVFPSREETKHN